LKPKRIGSNEQVIERVDIENGSDKKEKESHQKNALKQTKKKEDTYDNQDKIENQDKVKTKKQSTKQKKYNGTE